MLPKPKLGILGAGHMGQCLIAGLVADHYPTSHLWVSDHHQEILDKLKNDYHLQSCNDKTEMLKTADLLILAVKPQSMVQLCAEINQMTCQAQLIISVAAGITTAQLQQWLAVDVPIIRAMPNTPALLGSGATALFAASTASAQHCEWAEMIMRAVGTVAWIPQESLMDVVTALSGSGPAYFFWLMEALMNAAIEMGLEPKMAELLTLQTALGAAKMAMSSDQTVTDLRKQVTSPGGTTEAALQHLVTTNVNKHIMQAVHAAAERAAEIAAQFKDK